MNCPTCGEYRSTARCVPCGWNLPGGKAPRR